MEFRKLLLVFCVLLSPIIFAEIKISAEDSATSKDQNDGVSEATAADSSLLIELKRLESKIFSLETSIEEKTSELRRKDGSIKQLEKVIEEKSVVLDSLQTAVKSLQEKGSSDVKGRLGDVNTRVDEIEKQTVNLKKEIDAQNKKKAELVSRANAAEEKMEAMNLKLENLRKISDEQKSKIRNTQRALQVAEEEMIKAKLEASYITKQLKEVHEAWLPSWLYTHLVHFQSFVITHWNEHGKPALDLSIQEALKKKSEIEKWMQPHLETFKSKWVPIMKTRCQTLVDDFPIMVQSLSTQAIDYYHVAHNTIEPHVLSLLEIIDPYFQEAKMYTKPYIDQVSMNAKPYADKLLLFSKPYSKKVIRYRKKLTKNVRVYHSLVQSNLHKTLTSYELTKPLATEGLVWYMASALMTLPVVVLYKLLIRKKPKKHRRNTHTGHTRRRTKRVHTDNK